MRGVGHYKKRLSEGTGFIQDISSPDREALAVMGRAMAVSRAAESSFFIIFLVLEFFRRNKVHKGFKGFRELRSRAVDTHDFLEFIVRCGEVSVAFILRNFRIQDHRLRRRGSMGLCIFILFGCYIIHAVTRTECALLLN